MHWAVELIIVLIISIIQRNQARKEQIRQLQESIAGEGTIRPTDSGRIFEVGFGFCMPPSIPFDACGSPDWPKGTTIYQKASTINVPADLGLITRRGGWDGTGEFDADLNSDKDAVLVTREYMLANEIVEYGATLIDGIDGEQQRADWGKMQKSYGFQFARPGTAPPEALRVLCKTESGPDVQKWDHHHLCDHLFTTTDWHVNSTTDHIFYSSTVPRKRRLVKAGLTPKILRTGEGTEASPHVYDWEREADGKTLKLTWSRNWTRVRLMQRLAHSLGRHWGEIGLSPDDIHLPSCYE